MFKNIRGFKVTCPDRTRRIGIACKSLEDLKAKSEEKFNVSTRSRFIEGHCTFFVYVQCQWK